MAVVEQVSLNGGVIMEEMRFYSCCWFCGYVETTQRNTGKEWKDMRRGRLLEGAVSEHYEWCRKGLDKIGSS